MFKGVDETPSIDEIPLDILCQDSKLYGLNIVSNDNDDDYSSSCSSSAADSDSDTLVVSSSSSEDCSVLSSVSSIDSITEEPYWGEDLDFGEFESTIVLPWKLLGRFCRGCWRSVVGGSFVGAS